MRIRSMLAIAAVASLGAVGLAADVGADPPGDDPFAVRVTVTNLAPAGGTIQTPIWTGLHDGGFDLYDLGAPATAELERLAEDGDTAPLSAAFAATGTGTDATLVGPGGPLFPGDSASRLFVVEAGQPWYFSYASMVIPSNDAFVANGNPTAHPVLAADGTVLAADFVVPGSAVLDAGTEVNDEVPENTAALAQAAPDTGVTEGGVVGVHPGFMPGGNILNAIPNGDFTQPGYAAMHVSFDVSRVALDQRTIHSVLDGFQEVPANDSPSVGWANFRIVAQGARIVVRSEFWNTEDVVAAHLHLAPRGANGPVVVDLGALSAGPSMDAGLRGVSFDASALTGPLTGRSLAALIAEIEAGNVYINVHTVATPSGEMRGQLVPTP